MESALLDRFDRRHTYLRISVTDRCNFRCVYCMPEEGVPWRVRDEILTFEEILRLTKLFVSLGVNKVRLTGGEPTVRKGIEDLIGKIAAIPGVEALLMTTNGFTLPRMARAYREAGLTGLNVSMDSLRQERFKEITRTDHFGTVWTGIEAALKAGFEPLKVNVVVMSGVNEDEILDFVELTRDRPLNVRFIEFMPFDDNNWSKGSLYTYRQMRADIEAKYELRPLPTEPTAVAKDFAVPGFKGAVSFVTSMTEDFCAGCNRLRLTSEGALKPCLFAPLEVSLRDPMRAGASDAELTEIILRTVLRKPKGHASLDVLPLIGNKPMVSIGG